MNAQRTTGVICEMIVGTCSNPTHLKYSGEKIDLSTFEYKGCWNCCYYSRKRGKYILVKEAAVILDYTRPTIRKKCRNGKFNAYLCEKVRRTRDLGPKKLWVIFDIEGVDFNEINFEEVQKKAREKDEELRKKRQKQRKKRAKLKPGQQTLDFL